MPAAPGPAAALPVPAPLVVVAALTSALLIGLMLAVNVGYGIAAALAVVYAPLVFVDLPLAIAVWVGLTFVQAVPALGSGPLLAFLLIVFGWIGTLRRQDSSTRILLREQRGRIVVALALALWVVISLSWAPRPGIAGPVVSEWITAVALFAVVLTTIGSRRGALLVLSAFVVGAVVSVVLGLTGLASNDLYSTATAFETAGQSQRLRGGSGDPNFLAAGLIPALAIATALLAVTRTAWLRLLLAPAIVLIVVGFIAAESRGGLLAAGVAILVALLVGRQRAQLIAFIVAMAGFTAIWFAINPGSWQRVTSFDSQGNGRSDLWQVGVEIAEDHPVAGVGVANFRSVSPDYVRRPGELRYVNLIAERPLVVHNAYLQTLTELGLVGLALFGAIIFSSLRAALLAAREFERRRRMDMAALSRAVFVAIVAMLTASFFISSETDPRMWALFALGPALLGIARRAGHGERLSPSA